MNNQLSHEALTIYLRNLRTLEFIKYQCEKSVQKINNKSYSMERDLNNAKDKRPRPCRNEPKFSDFLGGLIFIFMPFILIAGLIVGFICDLIFIILPLFIIISIIVTCSYYNKDKEAYFADQRRFANEQRQYNNNVLYYQNRLSQFQAEAQKRIKKINTYRYHIDNMLKNAYSLNIIPQQFRGIYGVTYLYDFISTSNLSLSDAVLNCNLEQIKYKLDKIISKCDEIIRQQKTTNANLKEIQRQNNQLLKESKNISNNTALAVQYSEISAQNSAVSLELQKKQLAYQEVNFWLNSI